MKHCVHHYSIHTERTYVDWIKQYINFHRMKSRDDLLDGERKIEAFLTHLAIDEEGPGDDVPDFDINKHNEFKL